MPLATSPSLSRQAVAVVGSRSHTDYGVHACRAVVDAAVSVGAVVVSGMARGIDAQAHTRALDDGGDTIGILGNGIGVIYPAANRALYERVAREGLLLTEMPPGERPRIYTFPHRNRLIAGLATVTVVVEAARTSGSLITATAALDASREVLAVPGPITRRDLGGHQRPDSRWLRTVPHGRGPVVAVARRIAGRGDRRTAGAPQRVGCRRGSPPWSAGSRRRCCRGSGMST